MNRLAVAWALPSRSLLAACDRSGYACSQEAQREASSTTIEPEPKAAESWMPSGNQSHCGTRAAPFRSQRRRSDIDHAVHKPDLARCDELTAATPRAAGGSSTKCKVDAQHVALDVERIEPRVILLGGEQQRVLVRCRLRTLGGREFLCRGETMVVSNTRCSPDHIVQPRSLRPSRRKALRTCAIAESSHDALDPPAARAAPAGRPRAARHDVRSAACVAGVHRPATA